MYRPPPCGEAKIARCAVSLVTTPKPTARAARCYWVRNKNRMMLRMGRARRFFRRMTWAGGTACVLILIAWLWSTRNSALYFRDDWSINLFSGVLRFHQDAFIAAIVTRNQRTLNQSVNKTSAPPPARGIWSVVPVPSVLTSTYGFQSWHFLWTPRLRTIEIPMWTMFAAALTGTAVCAWLSRWRLRRGYCRECDYCLTGNTSGVCPECGSVVSTANPIAGSIT